MTSELYQDLKPDLGGLEVLTQEGLDRELDEREEQQQLHVGCPRILGRIGVLCLLQHRVDDVV